MSEPYEPELGFLTVGRALVVAIGGGTVDVAALRGRLVHLADQHEALARASVDGWDVGELGSRMAPDLLGVVDRLEAGQLRRAARRYAAVMRLHVRMREVAPDWTRIPPSEGR